jgi:type III pantothenate kinase
LFCKKNSKNVNILKIFTNTAHRCCVGGNVEKSLLEFEKRWKFILFPIPLSFVNGYETPQTLGIDRMVLAANNFTVSGQNRLVIDAELVSFEHK